MCRDKNNVFLCVRIMCKVRIRIKVNLKMVMVVQKGLDNFRGKKENFEKMERFVMLIQWKFSIGMESFKRFIIEYM